MPKLRVLIVDDSVVIRRLLSTILQQEPGIEVVGQATNGRLALDAIRQLTPDLVILDIEMPEMDGLQALEEIRKTWPRLLVLVLSALSTRGGEATFKALALGAADYMVKPAASQPETLTQFSTELVAKITALGGASLRSDFCNVQVPTATPRRAETEAQSADAAAGAPSKAIPIEILAIGVSTGGPNALAQLLPALSDHLPVPVVIVQHMPPVFTNMLAIRLAEKSKLTVLEGVSGTRLDPGAVYIAPGGSHMTVTRNALGAWLHTNQNPPENCCRPSVDVLFRSVAAAYGRHALGIILTGMGVDGLRGCRCLREAGGYVMAQDKESSVVWSMPGSVVKADLAHRVLPLERIGSEIVSKILVSRLGLRSMLEAKR